MYIPRYPKELQPASQSCAKLGSTSTFSKELGITEEPKEEAGSSWAAFPKDSHTVEDLVSSSSLMELWVKQ